MLAALQMRSLLVLLALTAIAAAPVSAQTNPTPTGPVTPPAAALQDPEIFFAHYREAVALVAKKREQDAGILLQGLAKKLGSAPWIDIALLKQAELIERSNDQSAMDAYLMLRQRLQNAPYFQGKSERAVLFSSALTGAINNGINRIRTTRVRSALDKYFARHAEYPESLTKLAILGYVEVSDTHDAEDKMFRYVPTGMQLAPFISYKRYEGLPITPPEPLVVASPRVDGTSGLEEPGKYAALLNLPGRMDALRVVENQTLEGYLVIAIANDGAIVTSRQRVLVLLTPK